MDQLRTDTSAFLAANADCAGADARKVGVFESAHGGTLLQRRLRRAVPVRG